MGGSSTEQQPSQPLPPGVAAVLLHPSGAQVYLVGVAHVSKQACVDVTDAITAIMPSVVVLELDQERYTMIVEESDSDPYGIRRRSCQGCTKPLMAVLRGDLVVHGLSLIYIIAGAVLGAPAGHEFKAAVTAANQVGARVFLGDRSQHVTMKRLFAAATELRTINTLPDTPPALTPARGTSTTTGLKGEDAMKHMGEQWNVFLRESGCSSPDLVLKSFRRMIQSKTWWDGAGARDEIDPKDVLIVRECGQRLVERLRQRAIQDGDNSLKKLEAEALRRVHSGVRLVGLSPAMHQVIGEERDLILARKCYEAAESGDTTVGVVGAAHIKGMKQLWHFAGTPEAAAQVEGLMLAPQPSAPASALSVALAGSIFGLLVYKRPRTCAKIAAVSLLLAAPAVGFMAVTLNSLSTLAERVVKVSQQIEAQAGDANLLDSQPPDMQPNLATL